MLYVVLGMAYVTQFVREIESFRWHGSFSSVLHRTETVVQRIHISRGAKLMNI